MLESNLRAFDAGFDMVDTREAELSPLPLTDPALQPDPARVPPSPDDPRRVQVLEHLCKGCGICVDVCPKDALAMSETLNSSGYYVAELVQPEACTSCRLCALMCPDVSLRVFA
jgi:2-oxoglutarate ferredoxin oxidoreductase subunit delta